MRPSGCSKNSESSDTRVPATLLPVIVFSLASLAFLSQSLASLEGFPLDDGWIHRVYGRSLAQGRGFEYNHGEQEAGSTSPLWAVVTAPAHLLEAFGPRVVVTTVKIQGFLLGIVVLMGVRGISKVLTGSTLGSAVSACLLAVSPRFLFASLSGMENILLLALWVHMAYAILQRRWWLGIILLSLMPITRPESLILFPLCAGVYWADMKDRSPNPKDVFLPVVAVAPFGLWLLFCYAVTGHPLPNTFYVKAVPFSLDTARLSVAWGGLTQHGYASVFLFWIGVLVLPGWIFSAGLNVRSKLGAVLLLVVGPLVYLLGVVGSRKVFLQGYYYTRWLVPPSLVLTVCFCIGMSLLIAMGFGKTLIPSPGAVPADRTVRKLGRRVMVVGLVLLGLSVPSLARSFLNLRYHLAMDTRVIEILNVNAGKWIKQNVPAADTVGVLDAGAIRYFGEHHTVDLAGLNSADVVFRRVPGEKMLGKIDWLAVFPALMPEQLLREHFAERKRFEIPLEEHTVLHNPLQTRKSIYEKRSPRESADTLRSPSDIT